MLSGSATLKEIIQNIHLRINSRSMWTKDLIGCVANKKGAHSKDWLKRHHKPCKYMNLILIGTDRAYLFHMVNYCNLSSPRIKILILINLAIWCNHNLLTSKTGYWIKGLTSQFSIWLLCIRACFNMEKWVPTNISILVSSVIGMSSIIKQFYKSSKRLSFSTYIRLKL